MPLATSHVYIGVDPGQSGGLVALHRHSVLADKMPSTEGDIWKWFEDAKRLGIPVAIIEAVHAFPGQGVASAFKFGVGYGGLRMALKGNGISFEQVAPTIWQRSFIFSRKRDESNTAWKNRLKGIAQQLFPDVNVILATADALIIAEYCRRKHKGTLHR